VDVGELVQGTPGSAEQLGPGVVVPCRLLCSGGRCVIEEELGAGAQSICAEVRSWTSSAPTSQCGGEGARH
jgi:hypothetical protein